jgi:hypothetical protein
MTEKKGSDEKPDDDWKKDALPSGAWEGSGIHSAKKVL